MEERLSGENQTVPRQSSDPTLGTSLSYLAALLSKFLRRTCARPCAVTTHISLYEKGKLLLPVTERNFFS